MRFENIVLRVKSVVTMTLTVVLMLANLLPAKAFSPKSSMRDLLSRIDRVQRELNVAATRVSRTRHRHIPRVTPFPSQGQMPLRWRANRSAFRNWRLKSGVLPAGLRRSISC